MRVFLLLFLLFPLLELAVMIKVGGSIGVLGVLLLIIGAGILGVMLIRVAGPAMALRARERLARGEMPEAAMLEGLMLPSVAYCCCSPVSLATCWRWSACCR